MPFDAQLYDIEDWLVSEHSGLLQKICNVVDGDGKLVQQYKTRLHIVPEGNTVPYGNRRGQVAPSAPSLYRYFTYDDEGNQIASLPSIREWTQACEDAAQGEDPIDPTPGGIPFGLRVAESEYEYNEINSLAADATAIVISKQLLPDEAIYLRHVAASGNNKAKYQVLVDGSPLQTKRSWFGDFDKDFWFHTANGGILYENEELITLAATNCSDDDEDGDFEGSIGFVVKEAP